MMFWYRWTAAFMDAVNAFNHLIPSDQLDETIAVGQNTDCEGGNDLGSVLPLEESLNIMLSDKDPMFGCTSSQFNLLDNEDPAFPVAGSTGMSTDNRNVKSILNIPRLRLWFLVLLDKNVPFLSSSCELSEVRQCF